jgi:hypothetical protein
MQTASFRRPWWQRRWSMPAFSLFLGGSMFAAFAIGGNTRAFLYEVADGHDASPYSQLGAVAGLAYIIGVVLLRRRW